MQSCLGSLYGSFLQSISFPLIQPDSGAGMEEQEAVCVMLDEINRFLKHKPNTWMKLVQIVCPPGLSPPGLVNGADQSGNWVTRVGTGRSVGSSRSDLGPGIHGLRKSMDAGGLA